MSGPVNTYGLANNRASHRVTMSQAFGPQRAHRFAEVTTCCLADASKRIADQMAATGRFSRHTTLSLHVPREKAYRLAPVRRVVR